MSGVRFVRMYPTDWRSGCIGLTPEEEGVYIRVCAHYWETGVRLTSDDLASASRVMLDVRMWKRLKARLIQKGKLHVATDGSIYSPRAEREFRKAAGEATQAQEKEPPAAYVDSTRGQDDREQANGRDQVQGRGVAWEELLEKSGGHLREVSEKSPRSRREVSENYAEKRNNINGPLIEPEPEPKKESPIAPMTFDDADGVRIVGGALVLSARVDAFWLQRFGGDRARLDLALIEAAANVNASSRTPLEVQVGRLLARIAGEKLDKDRRYAAAVADRKPQQDRARQSSRPAISAAAPVEEQKRFAQHWRREWEAAAQREAERYAHGR